MQATAICYYRRSKLPFARPQRPKTLRGSFDRQLRPGTQATAICYYRRSRLPFARPQRPIKRSAAASTKDQALRPQPSATIGGCRLPALKGLKRSAGPSTRHAAQSHLLLFARPQNLKRSAAASTSGSGHSHLLLSAFEAAVCPPSKA